MWPVQSGTRSVGLEEPRQRGFEVAEFRKWGGVSALVEAAAYIFGFGMALAVLVPAGYEPVDFAPGEAVAFRADNQTALYVWTFVIFIVAGVFMVPLALALHERLKTGSHALMQVATAFGLMWATLIIASGMLIIVELGVIADLFGKDPAQAETVWLSLSAVEEALGGGIELPGGMWVLLLSWAALRSGGLPKGLNYLGGLVGIAGILTVLPMLAEALTSAFGLGFIVWFLWAGVVMVRDDRAEAA